MIQDQLQQALQQAVTTLYPDFSHTVELTKPTQAQFGDFSSPVALSLAKQYQQSPMDIANQLVSQIKSSSINSLLSTVQAAAPGFVNLTLTNQALFSQLDSYQSELQQHPDQPGQGQTVMMEFSSPNIAKPFNVGHLRSTIIGDSLARIYAYLGYNILKDNHLGDWGTQYGLLAYAAGEWGDWAAIEANPIPELYKLYVRVNAEAEKDEQLKQAAQEYFIKLEQGDPHVREIWQKLSQLSQAEFDRLYQKFDVHFDMMLGEAFYQPYMDEVIDECLKAGVAQESQGALIIPFDDPKIQDPPLIIRKSNGTSTYATRDLAGIKYRFGQFQLNRLVIEIGLEQEYYFKQIIAASEKLGWIKPGQLVHVGHGLFLAESGKKMSTRRGETVWLDQLVQELEDKAQDIVASKSPDLPQEQQAAIAEAVAIGALKYNDLSQNRLSSIVFDKDKALNLEGNSAPYLQYTVARGRSVLRQADGPFSFDNLDELTETERSLVDSLVQFNQVVAKAAEEYLPNLLANHLFQTAQKFNSFYQADPILKAEPAIRQRRLAITQATVNMLTKGLDLLGVKVPERM